MIRARIQESRAQLKCVINTVTPALKCAILSNNPELKGYISISRGSSEIYDGEYTVTPKPFEEQTLETRSKLMANDVTVLAIPYYETSNISGITIYIGGE